jgi:hypothetical protein
MNAKTWAELIRGSRRANNPVVGYQVQYAIGSGFYLGSLVNDDVFERARRIFTLHAKPVHDFAPRVFHGSYWLQPLPGQVVPKGFKPFWSGHLVYENSELTVADELDLLTRRLILCGHNENSNHGEEKEEAAQDRRVRPGEAG